jgi:hypothetical protein
MRIKVEFEAGMDFVDCCDEAKEFMKKTGVDCVTSDMNGIDCSIYPGTDSDDFSDAVKEAIGYDGKAIVVGGKCIKLSGSHLIPQADHFADTMKLSKSLTDDDTAND